MKGHSRLPGIHTVPSNSRTDSVEHGTVLTQWLEFSDSADDELLTRERGEGMVIGHRM